MAEASLIRTQSLDPSKLELGLIKLVERYPHLQRDSKNYFFEVKESSAVMLNAAADLKNWCQVLCDQLDAVNGPVVSVGLLKSQSQDTDQLFVAIHNKFADRIAWRVFASELYACYYGHQLSTVQNNYAQWIYSLRAYAKESIIQQNHLDFWLRTVNKIRECKYFSQFHQAGDSTSCQKCIAIADRDVLQKLENICAKNSAAITLKEICLSAMLHAVLKVFGQMKIPCMVYETGRQHLYKAVDPIRLMGDCQIAVPKLFDISFDPLHAENPCEIILKHVIEQQDSQPSSGLSYAALRSFHPDKTVRQQLSLDRMPIGFCYQGQQDQLDPCTDWRIDTRYSCLNGIFSNDQHKLSVVFSINDGQLQLYMQCQYAFIGEVRVQELVTQIQGFLSDVTNEGIVSFRANQLPIKHALRTCIKRYEPLLVINREKLDSAPIVFVPPGGGGAENYLGIIQEMQLKDDRIILLNNYLRNSGDLINLPSNFEALASICVEQLVGQGLSKGLRLAGYSFGGVLAYEMALQLENQGVHVKDLFLIDPVFVGDFVNDHEIHEYKKLRRDVEFIAHYCVRNKRPPNANLHFFKSTKSVYFGAKPDINEQKIISALQTPLNGLTLPKDMDFKLNYIDADHYQLLSKPFIQKIMLSIFDSQYEELFECS